MTFLGHREVFRQLDAWRRRDEAGRGLLFSGGSGIGKRTVALHFAARLFCDAVSNEEAFPCETCPSCIQVFKGQCPDLCVVSSGEKSSISIQAIREAKAWASLAPLSGRKKVLIIDDAERLHRAAANALLKLLEEPRTALVIILVSAKPSRLPATVSSRVMEYVFSPPAWTPEVLSYVTRQVPDLSPELVERWFTILNGGFGYLLTHPVADLERLRQILFDTIIDCPSGFTRFPEDWAETLSEYKRDADRVFDLMASLFSDVSRLVCGVSSPLIHADLWEHRMGAVHYWSEARLMHVSTVLLAARRVYRDVLHADLFWEDVYERLLSQP